MIAIVPFLAILAISVDVHCHTLIVLTKHHGTYNGNHLTIEVIGNGVYTLKGYSVFPPMRAIMNDIAAFYNDKCRRLVVSASVYLGNHQNGKSLLVLESKGSPLLLDSCKSS